MNITYYHFADIFLSYIYYIIIIIIINELNFSAAFNMTLYIQSMVALCIHKASRACVLKTLHGGISMKMC